MRQGIDLAFFVGRGTERFAVVEVSATIPLPIPGVLFNVRAQLFGLFLAKFCEGRITASRGQRSKMFEHVVEKKSQPHAFAFAVLADHVHAVVPIAAADQRQPMFAELQSIADGAHTMLVERRGFLRMLRRVVIGFFFRTHRTAIEERNGFFQHAGVAGRLDVTTGRQRQPKIII